MIKSTKKNLLRGVTAIVASTLVLSTTGMTICNAWRSTVDDMFGTQSYVTKEGEGKYAKDYATSTQLAEASRAFAVKEGEEGFVLMQNDNEALPLKAAKKNIALFGGAAYNTYSTGYGGNAASEKYKKVTLESALTAQGFKVNSHVKSVYEAAIEEFGVTSRGSTAKTFSTATSGSTATDLTTGKPIMKHTITEYNVGQLEDKGYVRAQAQSDVAIVVLVRDGGEGKDYFPGGGTDTLGNTNLNPLKLSPAELGLIDEAKAAADKVVVLLNTAVALSVHELTEGAHKVDAIGYIGVPGAYQMEGIVNVLTGKVNATGALADTYAVDPSLSPAMMNWGGSYYADYEIANNDNDPRWPGQKLGNVAASSFGRLLKNETGDDTAKYSGTYNGGMYVIQAEGIYTGYNYYETRYFDSVKGQGNAKATIGSIDGAAWDYDKEVDFTFGHGLSYYSYTQTIKSVSVEDSVSGNVTAVIELKNTSNTDALLLAQLYVSQPYTEYDIQNKVEKSAIMFLNSAKEEVKAGETKEVTITVPTKYLASYDYTNAKTYVMDAGDYVFTAAAGAHEAVQNVLDSKSTKSWNKNKLDTKTYSVSESGGKITNIGDNISMDYYLPGKVTELTRNDWQATWPKNYNDMAIKIADSAKKDEWIKEIRGLTYELNTANGKAENVDGKDLGASYKWAALGEHPDAIGNFENKFWDELVSQLTANEAVGAVIHGGNTCDPLGNIDNPGLRQNDGPTGFNRKIYADATETFEQPKTAESELLCQTNINAPTLLGTSFNPELAEEWGVLIGNQGLMTGTYHVWAAGLNYHRVPYNARNIEYLSEDPMLTNVLGTAFISGSNTKGLINGLKHIGFNDQEYNRSGVSIFMNEQKLRQTDLRGCQGAVEDAEMGGAKGMMIAFNRLGATNAAHHVGMVKDMFRGEWGFKGITSTDMMNNKIYFNAESMVMSTITQVADFAAGNSFISKTNDHSEGDSVWAYLTVDKVAADAKFVAQARENMKYQLYTMADSAVANIMTERVVPAWESAIKGVQIASLVLTILGGIGVLALETLSYLKKEEK